MFKRKLTAADKLLLAANLVPIAGVLFARWDAVQVFLAYCLETVVIGLLTLTKLGVATAFRKTEHQSKDGSETPAGGLNFMLFFLLHYGLFVAVQTSLFLSAAKIGDDSFFPFFHLLTNPDSYLTRQGWLVLLIFALCYAYEQLASYFTEREFLTKPMAIMMFEPYVRIFIQQITVILGGLALGMGAGLIFLIIFAAAKTFFTVFLDYDAALSKFGMRSKK